MMRWIKEALSSKKIRTASILLLSVGLVFILCMSVWAAESDRAVREIGSFYLDTLETVHIEEGTAANELPLPKTITAQVYLATTESVTDVAAEEMGTNESARAVFSGEQPVSGEEAAIRPVELLEIPVTWESADYRSELGSYTFTAVLPEGYTTAQLLPQIRVEVAGQQVEKAVQAVAEELAPANVEPAVPTDPPTSSPAATPTSTPTGTPTSTPASAETNTGCTCGAAEGTAHTETCPLYTAPVCNCGAADGAAHAETCPLYAAEAMMMAAMYEAPVMYDLLGGTATADKPETQTIVEAVGGMTNTFDVTLRVYGKVQAVSDIVLVLDISGTMAGTPLREAKAGALQFVEALLNSPTSASRIALVTFDSNANQVTGFCGYAEKSTLINAISNLAVTNTSSTFTQGGIRVARNVTASASNLNGKKLVILSDGQPNLGYALNATFFKDKTTAYCVKNSDGIRVNPTTTPEEGFNTAATFGTAAYGCDLKDGYVYCDSVNSALSEANLAKQAGNMIYTIGYNVSSGSVAESTLQAIASSSSNYVSGTTGNISTVLKKLAGTLKVDTFQNGTIQSAIAPGFELDATYTITTKTSSYETTDAGKNITWTIPSIATPTKDVAATENLRYYDEAYFYSELKYRIKATDAITSIPVTPDADGKYITLKNPPNVVYTDENGTGSEVTLDNPPVPLEITPTPPINAIVAGDKVITGTSVPGAAVTVKLPDGQIVTTTTLIDGTWSVNVPSGTTLTEGQIVTATAKDGDKLTSLPGTRMVDPRTDVPGTLKGTVWIDANGDGKKDSGELPVSGLTLRVYNNDDTTCSTPVKDAAGNDLTVQTDATGAYQFNNVPAGTFKIVADAPKGYHATVLAQDNSAVDDPEKGWLVVSNLVIPASSTPTVLNQSMGLYAKLICSKSASVDGGAQQTGTAQEPIAVQKNQPIRFRINVLWEGTSGTVTGITVHDVFPTGLIFDFATPTAPADAVIDEDMLSIQWNNVTINPGDNLFEFTMYAEPLQFGATEQLYENTAKITRNGVEEGSNTVYLKQTKLNLYPLAVTKTLTAAAVQEETFVFRIQRLAESGGAAYAPFYATITVPRGQSTGSIRIEELFASTYSVTELNSNWRYSPVGSAEKTVVVTADGQAAIAFENDKTKDYWLSDKTEVSNHMILIPS